MMTDEDIIRLANQNKPTNPYTMVGIGMFIFIVFLIIFANCGSDSKPSKTSMQMITEKLDKGEELNWLEKKILNDALSRK